MKPLTENLVEWDKATTEVEEAQSILIVTHIDPDGDALGSMLGLANALRQLGKTVDTAVDDGTPNFLQYLPGSYSIIPRLTSGHWDLMISVDASDEIRTGEVGAYGRKHSKTIINLDHHVTNVGFGDVLLVMIDAVSASEVVYRWLSRFAPQTLAHREIALPLLTGLVTDTLGFRTSNVKPDTLGIAQKLMESGASLTEITARTLDSKPFKAVRLWSHALRSIDLEDGIVSVNITHDDLNAADMSDTSDGGLVSLLNQIDEAMVSVIFYELADNKVKISLRSKRGYDVGSVALAVGGGGHTQAAGATIPGPLSSARERIIPMLRQAVKEGRLIIA